jgi:Cu+-exporting ATPase
MEKISLKVEGMDCANCALTINKYLTKKGLQNVKVNFIGGDVAYDSNESISIEEVKKEIDSLGYKVVEPKKENYNHEHAHHGHDHSTKGFLKFNNHYQRFIFCLVFAAPLFLHMIIHVHFLMNPYVQLILTVPVYIVGMDFFGRSAIKSLLKGIPNMNVLIALGATAAFGYSVYGLLIGNNDYLFFETAATTITLVFLGNWMEDKSINTTQDALKKLAVSQKTIANMIAFDGEHQEQIFQVESKDLRVGDLVLIKVGEAVPMDCKILWGEVNVSEAIITGESIPLNKKMNDILIGGSMIESGTVKAQITAIGQDTVLSHILKLIKEAETEKPPVQQMTDKISAVFVPVVLCIAIITIAANYFIAHQTFTESLLRSIAVMVIACPCAMGLATPAAVAVGLGRAARNGILFKNAKSLEVFKDIRQAVFDKTGTLTTGNFEISNFQFQNINEENFKSIIYSLEKFSNHPIGIAIAKEWKSSAVIRWNSVEEIKGVGIKATDKEGNCYVAGSYKIVSKQPQEKQHNIYVLKNNELLGWIDVEDEIREEAKQVIADLQKKGIKTFLLSGDKQEKCLQVANTLGIDTVIAEQTPEQKLEQIATLTQQAPTVMIGDGINDGPALAKATVGVSLSEASQVAMQIAQVVLMNDGLKNLPLALGLGKHTYITIKENLFWALAYNIVAIPIAALGLLGTYGPTYGALIMGLSDVVLAVNSVRLNFKKVI